ncbi:MAG TPA: YqeG family HAD IIIA-type phosphatase [Phycisphaerales bacterium]|nr:YqeG family HAD IIIA-type phosphatase [Phycisphaerales bacterium]
MSLDPHLRPDQYLRTVQDIDFQALAERGIRHFCFDLDNTLVPQFSSTIVPEAKAAIQQARAKGYIEKIALISNVLIWGPRTRRLARLAKELDIENVYPGLIWRKKPGPKPFLWALKVMGVPGEKICMVGDQIYSDILGGNRFGFHTILVQQLGGDHWTTKITGRREREIQVLKELGLEPQ